MRERRQARQHANRCNPQVNAHILVHMLNAVADVVGQDAGNRRVLVRAFVEEHRAAEQHNAVAGQDAGENAQPVRLNAEKSFTAFGVSYLPFGVLTDAKNRTLWMGNSLQINEKLIEQSTR